MALKIGNITPSKLYLGSTEIQKAYLGSNLVWDKTGGGFDADYQAVLDYATTQGYTLPSASQQALQNQLVLDLKSGGIWSKLDIFYTFATDGDSDFATLNWKAPSNYQITKVNSPTFTTNDGFKGDGTSSHLDTGWNESNGTAVDLTNRLMHIAAWTYDSGTLNPDGYYVSGKNSAFLLRTKADKSRLFGQTITHAGFDGDTGFQMISQDATNMELFLDNTTSATGSRGTSTLGGGTYKVFADFNGSLFSDKGASILSFGADLNAEASDYHTALNDYMTSI